MKAFLKALSVLAVAVVAGGYLYLKAQFPSYSWHQKIVVEVETPGGLVSGFSIQEVTLSTTLHLGAGGKAAHVRRTGEAVVVALPEGKHLFLLLPQGDTLAQYVVLEPGVLRGSLEVRGEALENGVGRSGPVPPEHLPLLVTFDDITDPATVRKVDPQNLAATFGEGYALKSVTLEITNDPVTKGDVEKVLGRSFYEEWGRIHEAALKRGIRDPYFKSLLGDLSTSDFRRSK